MTYTVFLLEEIGSSLQANSRARDLFLFLFFRGGGGGGEGGGGRRERKVSKLSGSEFVFFV